ncbi:unnamed protein product [Leptidea sinapis]|uniref:Uncharacterized protein n=1 Tax=Leptidea sinapis TaxID=189913 RepID=A0A5E4QPM2_9NEOP|nr:unnamed protein product [Leptidea sinapis]
MTTHQVKKSLPISKEL